MTHTLAHLQLLHLPSQLQLLASQLVVNRRAVVYAVVVEDTGQEQEMEKHPNVCSVFRSRCQFLRETANTKIGQISDLETINLTKYAFGQK